MYRDLHGDRDERPQPPPVTELRRPCTQLHDPLRKLAPRERPPQRRKVLLLMRPRPKLLGDDVQVLETNLRELEEEHPEEQLKESPK